mmetsp:Transcript_53445/g.115514  ORF Transcript_53445/g.115514 Transcript_53445/m.115514 type:complete len:529 (+) Transcript_53445:1062-2648(+)
MAWYVGSSRKDSFGKMKASMGLSLNMDRSATICSLLLIAKSPLLAAVRLSKPAVSWLFTVSSRYSLIVCSVPLAVNRIRSIMLVRSVPRSTKHFSSTSANVLKSVELGSRSISSAGEMSKRSSLFISSMMRHKLLCGTTSTMRMPPMKSSRAATRKPQHHVQQEQHGNAMLYGFRPAEAEASLFSRRTKRQALTQPQMARRMRTTSITAVNADCPLEMSLRIVSKSSPSTMPLKASLTRFFISLMGLMPSERLWRRSVSADPVNCASTVARASVRACPTPLLRRVMASESNGATSEQNWHSCIKAPAGSPGLLLLCDCNMFCSNASVPEATTVACSMGAVWSSKDDIWFIITELGSRFASIPSRVRTKGVNPMKPLSAFPERVEFRSTAAVQPRFSMPSDVFEVAFMPITPKIMMTRKKTSTINAMRSLTGSGVERSFEPHRQHLQQGQAVQQQISQMMSKIGTKARADALLRKNPWSANSSSATRSTSLLSSASIRIFRNLSSSPAPPSRTSRSAARSIFPLKPPAQ